MVDDKISKELADQGGAGGYPKENTPEEDYEHVRESIESGIPTIHIGGPAGYCHQVAYEIWGKFKIVHNDGTEEIVEGKTPLCACGHSKQKPYCDQTHQKFLADPDNPKSAVLWEYLTNEERYKILNGIKVDQKAINKRHTGKPPTWMGDQEDNNG